LNQLLYNFQKKLGQQCLFISRGEDLGPGEPSPDCDIGEFQEAIESQAFSTAHSILTQGFAALVVDDSPRPFHDWLVARDAEFCQEFRRAAEAAWKRFSGAEDWHRAAASVRALLDMAPEDEVYLQNLLEALIKIGEKDEAEVVFRRFCQERKGPEWVPPKEMADLLTTPTLPPNLRPTIPTESLISPAPPPLQGRNQERNLLRRTLAAAPSSEIRGILVSGEAGIGKTRLIQEAIRGIPLDGQRVLAAESAELEQLIPLNPLIEMFRAVWVGDVLRTLDEPWRTVLYGVMPGHYPGEGPVPDAPQIQAGSVPRRLFEAFYQLLSELVEDGPLILVFEDLQWADETTLSVLEFLIRRWDAGELQVLMSVRSDEVRKSQVLKTFLGNLRVHVDFLEVELTDLDPHDSEALIRHITDEPFAVEKVARLRSLAGGNPFFLIQLTYEFIDGRLSVPVAPDDLVQIPLSIRQVLDRRFSQLSAEAERVLGALAVFSRPLDLASLEVIAELGRAGCLVGLDQLHRFRLLTSTGTSVMISHELVRHTVYQNLTSTRKAWLHAQVGKHLTASEEPVAPGDLAIHYHHAGLTEEARELAAEAAKRAESSGAVAEALRFLRIAREHATDPETVATLINRMGHLHYLHQNLEEAAPLLELAAQRFRRQGKIAEALEAEVEWVDCLAQSGALTLEDCFEELASIQAVARSEGEWEVLAKALDVEARRADHAGRSEIVKRVMAEALVCSDRDGPETRCKARAILALNIYYGDPAKGLASAREAVRISLKTRDSDLQLHALNRLIVVMLYQGTLNSPEGTKAFKLAEERLKTSGDLNLRFFIKLNRAVWLLEAGELDRSELAFSEVFPVIKGTRAEEAHTIFHLNRGELRLSRFEYEEARVDFEAAERHLRPQSSNTFRSIINAGLGQCAFSQGDLAEARKREATIGPLPRTWTFDPGVITLFKANMLRRRGDYLAADRLIEAVSSDVQGRLVTPWIRLNTYRARLLLKLDRIKAQELLEGVSSVADSLDLRERSRVVRQILEAEFGS
jgi:tetratricopeptide (TPR) repeat protein